MEAATRMGAPGQWLLRGDGAQFQVSEEGQLQWIRGTSGGKSPPGEGR